MNKLTKLTVCVLILSCSSGNFRSLENDAIINKHFCKKEIHELSKILSFFESQVGIERSTSSIYESYDNFFETLNIEEKKEIIAFDEQVFFLSGIDSKLLEEIWLYENEFVPYLNDTIKTLQYPWEGKYFDFLFEASEKDKGIARYFECYTISMNMSPYIHAATMKYHKEDGVNYNLNLERNRLIIAINFLIYNEQLNIDKLIQSKKKPVPNK